MNTIQTVKLSDTKKYTIEPSMVYDEEKGGLIPVFYTEVLVLEGFNWTTIDTFMAFLLIRSISLSIDIERRGGITDDETMGLCRIV